MSNDENPVEPNAAAGGGTPPTEEELLAAYEAQMKQIRVEDLVVQSLASLVELAGRRAGLVPGAEDEVDAGQLRLAIEAIRALQPLAAPLIGPSATQIEQALSQLQIAYAKLAGTAGESGTGDQSATPPKPQSSGRLWVPGQ